MTEEELKNKCKERAKIFQQAMESCKSSNPIDCIEWFADRIAELEKENAELRDNYDQFKAIAEPEIERLKKKNANQKSQLEKAVEIIRELGGMVREGVTCHYLEDCGALHRATSFLKEIDK